MSKVNNPKKKSTILIVDDKVANLHVLENLLERQDRKMFRANSGEEALKITIKEQIDLILLDVQMPGMDGFEVAQVLKTNFKTRDIPIIFVTAEAREQKIMIKGYEEGAIDFLYKPLDPILVEAKVSVLLKLQMQKKELQEKNESLLRSELMIDNSTDIIGIIDIESLHFEFVNSAYSQILGYSYQEAVGSSLLLILSNEDRKKVKKYITSGLEKHSFETLLYGKDRSEKWLQWNVVSKYRKWFFNARDITEIKKVERIRNYLAIVVKQSNDAVYIFDHEGRIISWNSGAEKIYGYTENEAMNMRIWNIIPVNLHPEAEKRLRNLQLGQRIESTETRRITKHGVLIDVIFTASPIEDPYGNQLSFAITERDITKEKLAQQEIKRLNQDLRSNITQLEFTNKELESFSYSVSHDLRAPLRAMSGYSKMLEEDYGSHFDSDAMRMLGNIQDNARRMGLLIDDLLAFSRLGRKEVVKGECNMEHIVYQVLDEIKKTNDIRAHIEINELSSVCADTSLIKQVWVNLISNAIKYSSKMPEPNITIGNIVTDTDITYYIKDNGTGFNMEYHDKMFGVFQRLHSNEEFEGTGVGLAIVQRVIVRHNGRVWAESEVGKGATFYFTLPITESDEK